jgi:hypothetical protein
MLHRHLFSFTMTIAILATGCGDDHKTDDRRPTATRTRAEAAPATTPTVDDAGDDLGTTGESTGGTTAAVEPPAAPTELMAGILEGGVHVTWKDASDNEDNFILENKADGEAQTSRSSSSCRSTR